jgi:hypothetical protein
MSNVHHTTCQAGLRDVGLDARAERAQSGIQGVPTSGIADKLNHHLFEIEDRKP